MRNVLRLYKTMLGGAVAATALLLPQAASAANCSTGSTRMAEILNTTATADTLVLAHRGWWGKYLSNNDDGLSRTPENSFASLYMANHGCFDGVELDVKLTQDGIPILMHDFNLGRTTTVYDSGRGLTKYNPSNNTGHNPAVKTTSWKLISTLYLLTPDRSKSTGAPVPRVDDLFNHYKKNNLTIPMIFDTKDAASVKAISNLAKQNFTSASQVVAVKVNATLYPNPDSYVKDAPYVTGIPVFTTNMVSKIDVKAVREAWQKKVKTLEINVKEENGLLQGQLDSAESAGQRVGVFQAIPDGPGTGQFYRNWGQCCYKLSDLYYNGKEGKDTNDKRGDLGYLVTQAFGLITTDDPSTVVATLGSKGHRKSHPSDTPSLSDVSIPKVDVTKAETLSDTEKATSDETATTSPEPDDMD